MRISEDIKEVHQKFSRWNRKFLEFIEKNPAGLKAANFPKIKEYDDGVITLQPWPTFINAHTDRQIEETASKVFDLIKSLPQRIFSNNPREIGRYFGYPEDQVMYFLLGTTGEHMKNLFGRGDFMLTSSGLKCLEYNIASNIGGWQLPIYQSMYLQNPIIAKFAEENNLKVKDNNLVPLLFGFVIDNALKNFPHTGGEMNVALVEDWKKDPFDRSPQELYLCRAYKDLLEKEYKGLAGELITCDYPHLETKEGGVFFRGKKIHVIIEHYGGYVPMEMLAAFQVGDVMIYNGTITPLVAGKLTLALLSENKDSGYFSPGEKEIIEKHVPWTRKIVDIETHYQDEKVKLPAFIRSHRENLVIKPSDGSGGDGVYVGEHTPPAQWEKVLDEALKQGAWLAQERVEPVRLLYQWGEEGCCLHDSVWGIFTFGDRYAGGFLRVMPEKIGEGVINCKQGATVSILIEAIE